VVVLSGGPAVEVEERRLGMGIERSVCMHAQTDGQLYVCGLFAGLCWTVSEVRFGMDIECGRWSWSGRVNHCGPNVCVCAP
jgi:hypothetical protein